LSFTFHRIKKKIKVKKNILICEQLDTIYFFYSINNSDKLTWHNSFLTKKQVMMDSEEEMKHLEKLEKRLSEFNSEKDSTFCICPNCNNVSLKTRVYIVKDTAKYEYTCSKCNFFERIS
jgi:hypothetical protein